MPVHAFTVKLHCVTFLLVGQKVKLRKPKRSPSIPLETSGCIQSQSHQEFKPSWLYSCMSVSLPCLTVGPIFLFSPMTLSLRNQYLDRNLHFSFVKLSWIESVPYSCQGNPLFLPNQFEKDHFLRWF